MPIGLVLIISDRFSPLETTFNENKRNDKSKGEALLKFTNHEAALKAKVFLMGVLYTA
jgi:RNA recognition motif-containing protein